MSHLSKNLRYLAARADIKQAALGERLGVEQSTVQRIMRGKTEFPRLDSLLAISAHFRISLDDLVHRDLEADGVAPSQPVGLDVGKLADLLGTVEAAVEKSGIKLAPRVKARLVSTLYVDKEASAAASAQAVQAALVGILATMETVDEPDASR